jgi:hypothetical protein
MVIDAHTHVRGEENGDRILRAMDRAGIDRMVLLGPSPGWHVRFGGGLADAHRRVIDLIAKVTAPDCQRLIGFAWIEPTLKDAPEAVDYALGEKGLWGIKMIPWYWYPSDERAIACYERVNAHGKPLTFHTGSLGHSGDTSRFCRPVYTEIFLRYPRMRFVMAHLGWPWIDECIAACHEFRFAAAKHGGSWNSYADTASGPPPVSKIESLPRIFAVLGDTQILYGTDCGSPSDSEALRYYMNQELDILDRIGASQETVDRVMGLNALRWLGVE